MSDERKRGVCGPARSLEEKWKQPGRASLHTFLPAKKVSRRKAKRFNLDPGSKAGMTEEINFPRYFPHHRHHERKPGARLIRFVLQLFFFSPNAKSQLDPEDQRDRMFDESSRSLRSRRQGTAKRLLAGARPFGATFWPEKVANGFGTSKINGWKSRWDKNQRGKNLDLSTSRLSEQDLSQAS